MKICFVTSTLISGGSERVMSLLANRFVEDGYDVEIINLNQHVVFYHIDSRVSLLFAEDEVGRSPVKKLKWLRKYVKQTRPDVVVPFMEAVYCFTLCALVGVDVPVVSSERIDPRKSPFLRNILRRVFLPLTDWLVVQTQDIKDFYPRFIQKKTSIIYNPVSEKVFNLPDVEKTDMLISVGKLDDQKNHSLLINAFAKVAQDFPSWKLVIYGEGPLRDSLELIVDSLQLQGRVLLPGRSEHVIEEMNKSKIFVFSSNYEGMSNAILEAVCVGLPVVTTNVSGAKELVQDGGYVVPIKSEEHLVQSMRSLMKDSALRKEMGEKNKIRAFDYKIDRIYREWVEVISNIVKNNGRINKKV